MTDVASIIRQRAMAEWPDDFAMQKHEIEKQTEAAERMQVYREQLDQNNEIVNNCLQRALVEWGDDYSMQLYEFEKQIESATDFFSYENARLPDDVLSGIKQRAFQQWDGDYSMMHYELSNQVEAWLSLHP